MNVHKSVVDSVAVITLSGDEDTGSTDLLHADVASVMPAHAEVLLDLSRVAHLSAAGVRLLLLLYRQGQCLDSAVAVVGMSHEVRAVLAASGFLGFFRTSDTVADGVALLARASGRRDRVDV